MNEERIIYDDVGATQTVYTDPTNDPAGISREIPRGEDILYPGSCEADVICYTAVEAEGAPCQEGFICDEATSSERSIHYECKAGYVCGFGTTPDATLLAPMGQFRRLCPAGYVCNDGTELGQAYNALCPAAAPNYYFCPTGTGNVILGTAANDGVSRGLSKEQIDPYHEEIHVRLTENDDIRVISTHDRYCFSGSDVDLSIRYLSERIPISEEGTDPELKLQNPFLQFLNTYVPGKLPYIELSSDGSPERPVTINEATWNDLQCARDHKWRHVEKAVLRKECNCTNFFEVTAAMYRLWRCTSDGDDYTFGIGSVEAKINTVNMRDRYEFWFNRTVLSSEFNEDMTEHKNQCEFGQANSTKTLLSGPLIGNPATMPIKHQHDAGASENVLKIGPDQPLHVRFKWLESRVYKPITHDSGNNFQCQVTVIGKRKKGDLPICANVQYNRPANNSALPGGLQSAMREVDTSSCTKVLFIEDNPTSCNEYMDGEWRVGSQIWNCTLPCYNQLRADVEEEFAKEYNEIITPDDGRFSQIKKQAVTVRQDYWWGWGQSYYPGTDFDLIKEEKRHRMDPYIYDLHRAIRLVEEHGSGLLDLMEFEEYYDELNGINQFRPVRWDMCECEFLYKCPNGTITSPGATSLDDCTSTGTEVLRRVNLIPPSKSTREYSNDFDHIHNMKDTWDVLNERHLENMTDFWELGGADDTVPGGKEAYPVGTLKLEAFDVAVITVDLSALDTNMTYGEHYLFSTYVDCKPCPPYYLCDYSLDPPTCDYPPLTRQKQLFEDCLERNIAAEKTCIIHDGYTFTGPCDDPFVQYANDGTLLGYYEKDLYKCQQIPFFCDDQYFDHLIYDVVESAEGVRGSPPVRDNDVQADSVYRKTNEFDDDEFYFSIEGSNDDMEKAYFFQRGCCQCERHQMPKFFEVSISDLGFPDNKHGFVQLQFLALNPVELTVVAELLHGQYIDTFDRLLPTLGDVYVHRPTRAHHKADRPSRRAFLAMIDRSQEEATRLPLNLPFEKVRIPRKVPGTSDSTTSRFEHKVLIDRISDINAGDASYAARQAVYGLDAFFTRVYNIDDNTPKTFDQCLDYCEAQGLEMGCVPNYYDEVKLINAATSEQCPSVWVGYDDRDNNNDWSWVSGCRTQRVYGACDPDGDSSCTNGNPNGMCAKIDPRAATKSNMYSVDSCSSTACCACSSPRTAQPFRLPPSTNSSVSDILKLVNSASADLYMVPDERSEMEFSGDYYRSGDAIHAPTGFDHLYLPYLPYFSNCKGSDSHIVISKLFEDHPHCTTVNYDSIVHTNEYDPFSFYPNADQCKRPIQADEYYRESEDKSGLKIWYNTFGPYYDAEPGSEDENFPRSRRGATFECAYEEDIQIPVTTAYRWYEMQEGEVIFHMYKYPAHHKEYASEISIEDKFVKFDKNLVDTYNYDIGWGRGDTLNNKRGTYELLPVYVGAGSDKQLVPRSVILRFEFYQKSDGTKKVKQLVNCFVYFPFSHICHAFPPGSPDAITKEEEGYVGCYNDVSGKTATKAYELEIQFEALNYWQLLDRFQFGGYVMFMLFVGSGLMTSFFGSVVWLINRMLTKLRHPPPFHGYVLLYTIMQPAMIGVSVGMVPIFLAVTIVFYWLANPEGNGGQMLALCSGPNAELPSSICLEHISGDLKEDPDMENVETYRAGRRATMTILIGLYALFYCSWIVIPNWNDPDFNHLHKKEDKEAEKKQMEEDGLPETAMWQPHIWRRGNVVWWSLIQVFLLMVQMEFSYSGTFGDNTVSWILTFKFLYILWEVTVLEVQLLENMNIAPLVAASVVISNMTTMGASSFSGFVLSFFADLFLTIIERLFLAPLIVNALMLYPRWRLMLIRQWRGKKRMTRDEKANEELEWRRINEEIELESEGIEPMLGSYADYAVDCTALIITPIINIWLGMFYGEAEIASNYEILENQMIYYILFAFVIIPFQFICDVFLLNAAELVHGWKVYDYVAYQRYRFSVRDERWMLRNAILDESISESMQTTDMLCFSSQFYFIITLFCFGLCIGVMGVTILVRKGFNPFGDYATPLLWMIVFVIGKGLEFGLIRLANVKIKRFGWRGLWMTNQVEGTVDDDVAAKLAIGEGRQQDLEQERLELQALNSERFRHRFLERNRPWILQHLVELLTPRQLDEEGPDDRPVIEYVRDVYSDLMAMGEGT